MRVIAVANQKGGVGKTTTAVTLGHALAIKGLRILLVDLDSQGNVAVNLGYSPAPGVYRVLVGQELLQNRVVEMRKRLWVLPGNSQTATLKEIMTGMNFREIIVRRMLEGAEGEYDIAILDCAPSLDILNVAALVAADNLLIPVAVDYLATVGLAQHVKSLIELRQAGHKTELRWVVPTFYDEVTKESKSILGELADHFGPLVTAPIHRSVRVREAPAFGKTIWEHAPKCRAAEDYIRLVERVVRDTGINPRERWTDGGGEEETTRSGRTR